MWLSPFINPGFDNALWSQYIFPLLSNKDLGNVALVNSKFASLISAHRRERAKKPKPNLMIVSGRAHVAFLYRSAVYVLGDNNSGQIGIGRRANYDPQKPTKVTSLNDKNIIDLIGGTFHTMAVVAEDDGKTVYAWGGNYNGQLGLGCNYNIDSPTKVTIPGINNIVKVISRGFHTFFIVKDQNGNNAVRVCGRNIDGELGLGHNKNVNTPTEVTALKGKKIIDVRLGGDRTFFIVEEADGSKAFYGCGKNKNAELGLGHDQNVNTPQRVTAIDGNKIIDVKIGGHNSFFIVEDKNHHTAIYGCGLNNDGELGLGHNDPVDSPKKLPGFDDKTIIDVIAGGDRTYFIVKEKNGDKAIYACGKNFHGELGLGHNHPVNTPQKVTAIDGNKIVKVITGSHRTFFILDNGINSVYGCGSNFVGELVLGHKNDVNTPTPLPLINFFKQEILQDQRQNLVTTYSSSTLDIMSGLMKQDLSEHDNSSLLSFFINNFFTKTDDWVKVGASFIRVLLTATDEERSAIFQNLNTYFSQHPSQAEHLLKVGRLFKNNLPALAQQPCQSWDLSLVSDIQTKEEVEQLNKLLHVEGEEVEFKTLFKGMLETWLNENKQLTEAIENPQTFKWPHPVPADRKDGRNRSAEPPKHFDAGSPLKTKHLLWSSLNNSLNSSVAETVAAAAPTASAA